jgi:hypothetical protein
VELAAAIKNEVGKIVVGGILVIPVKQLILHDPANGKYGDCFRACVASLMEFPCEKVPHFFDKDDPDGWYMFKQYCIRMGYEIFSVYDAHPPISYTDYYIATGHSPRFPDALHCTIYRRGILVHDPHPDNSGILDITECMWLRKKENIDQMFSEIYSNLEAA